MPLAEQQLLRNARTGTCPSVNAYLGNATLQTGQRFASPARGTSSANTHATQQVRSAHSLHRIQQAHARMYAPRATRTCLRTTQEDLAARIVTVGRVRASRGARKHPARWAGRSYGARPCTRSANCHVCKPRASSCRLFNERQLPLYNEWARMPAMESCAPPSSASSSGAAAASMSRLQQHLCIPPQV